MLRDMGVDISATVGCAATGESTDTSKQSRQLAFENLSFSEANQSKRRTTWCAGRAGDHCDRISTVTEEN